MQKKKWTAPLVFKRAIEVFHTNGIQGLWFGIMGECFYRRLILFNRPLDEPIELIVPKIPVKISELTQNNVNDYICFRPDENLSEIQHYLNIGHRCFVAYYEKHIVSASWVASGEVWIDYLFFNITIAPNDIYLYNLYTLPDYRSKNIASAIVTKIIKTLINTNYQYMILNVLPESKGVIQMYKKIGFQSFGLIGFKGIGQWKRPFCRINCNAFENYKSCPGIISDRNKNVNFQEI